MMNLSKRKVHDGTGNPPLDPGSRGDTPKPAPSTVWECIKRQAGSGCSRATRGWRLGAYSRKSSREVAVSLFCVLTVVASFGSGGMGYPRGEKSEDSAPQLQIVRASSGTTYLQIGRLFNWMIRRGAGTEQWALPSSDKELVQQSLSALMREFGAEDYRVPSEFVKQVDRFVKQYQGRDRDIMRRALVGEREKLERMRRILQREHMPEDLAYMTLVESGFVHSSLSHEGAAGLWQLSAETARAYGMEVDDRVDDRFDPSKSTVTASRYIRDLILDFGNGSSVMLAIAAYNSGPETVRHAIRSVPDPINQRNFWYLYQTRALPSETREYVPKVFAAILIGRAPQRFGF